MFEMWRLPKKEICFLKYWVEYFYRKKWEIRCIRNSDWKKHPSQ